MGGSESNKRDVSPDALRSVKRRVTHHFCNRIAHSPKGYTDSELAMKLMHHFHEQTKDKNEYHRLLFFDGHISHCSSELVDFCRDRRIIIITYPPHTTHELQGLDDVPFAAMKKHWAKERHRLELDSIKVTKSNFLKYFAPVYQRTFTKENILSAWRRVGLIPFNPSVITAEKLAPSTEMSINVEMPTSLDGPFQAVLEAASSSLMATSRRTNPGPPSLSTQSASSAIASSPVNPFRVPAPQISPSILRTSLRDASVSFLVDADEPFSSESRIPAPQFEHPSSGPNAVFGSSATFEELLEENERLKAALKAAGEQTYRVQAQLVLQTMYSRRLKATLYAKEQKAVQKNGRIHLLSRKAARVLTSDEFREALRLDDERVAAEAEAERLREPEKERREALKAWRKARDNEVAKMREEQFQADCERCAQEGLPPPTKRRRLPNGSVPKTPEHLKLSRAPPQSAPVAMMDVAVDEDEEEDGEDEDEGMGDEDDACQSGL